MKNDPYAGLSGLDQELFRGKTPKQRNNETTLPRDNAGSVVGTSQVTSEGRNRRGWGRSIDDSRERKGAAPSSPVSGIAGPAGIGRISERHSHDIFLDQVRWLARVKLEIEERFGERVTANAMVQLAIDLLIADFQRRGDESQLMKKLVLDRQRPVMSWEVAEAEASGESNG